MGVHAMAAAALCPTGSAGSLGGRSPRFLGSRARGCWRPQWAGWAAHVHNPSTLFNLPIFFHFEYNCLELTNLNLYYLHPQCKTY